MDPLERLALQAALLPREQALDAWTRLTDDIAWMVFPDPVQRCLPAIAVNLGCHGSPSRGAVSPGSPVPHASRLGGVYRATWADNITRLRGTAPLLERLGEARIDARVLKGAAICAITDRWGARPMGDIDIVVDRAQARTTTAVLRGTGYRPRFARRISDTHPPQSACWEGPDGQVIDLHIARGDRRPTSLLDWARRAPAVTAESQGITWAVPPAEVMLLHALVHARLAAARSDHAQALLDAPILLPRVDTARLHALARRTGTTGLVQALESDLAEIHGTAPSMAPAIPAQESPRWQRAWTGELRRSVSLPRIIVERRLHPRDLRRALQQAHVRRGLYVSWLTLGQLRPLERAVMTAVGGFLTETPSSVALQRELRVRVGVRSELIGRPAKLLIRCSDARARVLFVNGESVGVLTGEAGVWLDRLPGILEISARFLGDPSPRRDDPGTLTVECASPSTSP